MKYLINKRKGRAFLLLFMLSIILYSKALITNSDTGFEEITITAVTIATGDRPDYLNLLKQQLAVIGINVDVKIYDWWDMWEISAFRNYDIFYLALSGGTVDPDYTGVYNENGSLNLSGYHTDMDYDEDLGTGINEWYLKEGTKIMPPYSEERIEHYWAWEQYLMDKILPLKPTFTTHNYQAYWSNLQGYNFSDGILQSWGKMSWDGSHFGQISTNELITTNFAWSDQNPLFQDDSASNQISDALMDRLIWYDSDMSAWPNLAKSYTMINSTHVRINCRGGIKWQSDPDGNFTDEYFDAEDVYFTLYSWAELSNDQQLYEWIEDMAIIDAYTIDIWIDGDPDTPENEPYSRFLERLSINILPEHYLNQTQLGDGVTPDFFHPSWNTFAIKSFGTGLFEIDTFTEGVETILKVNPDCWKLNTTITSDPDLNFVERFGDFSGGLDTWRIRIIPDLQTALNEFEIGYKRFIPRAKHNADPGNDQRDAVFVSECFCLTR